MIDTFMLIAFGVHPTQAKVFGPLMEPMFKEFEIELFQHQAAIVAQAMHESGNFTRMEESTYYSKPSIMKNAYVRLRGVPDSVLLPLCKQPEAFGNYVYANMLGNGNAASGDGYRYRGRGLFQLTGRANYRDAGKDLSLPLETEPKIAATPEVAVRTAGWFWRRNNLGYRLSTMGINAVSRRINGGDNGLPERAELFQHCLECMA